MSEQEHKIPQAEVETNETKEVSLIILKKIRDAAESGYYANDPRSGKQKLHDIMILMKDILEKKV